MRLATTRDIPALLVMGRKFHEQAGLPFGFDDDAVSALLGRMIESEDATVIVTDRGLIGGMLNAAYCDPSWVMAIELFWWAEGDGLSLLRAFEDWARQRGANEVRMTSIAELSRADTILRRKGYQPTEISYMKVLP